MARIRTLKPDFWQDEDLAEVSESALILAAGLLNHADDEGYFRAATGLVKAAVFPLREPSLSIQGGLTELSNIGYLELFEGADGKKYGFIPGFIRHQKVSRPTPSKIKHLRANQGVLSESSVSPRRSLTPGTGKGRERKGKEGGVGETKKAREKKSEPKSQQQSRGADAPINGEILKSLNQAAWQKYISYRRSSKLRKLQPGSEQQQQRWLTEQGGKKTQAAIVDETIRNNWQGLFALKNNGTGTPPPQLKTPDDVAKTYQAEFGKPPPAGKSTDEVRRMITSKRKSDPQWWT